jgi:O-antigen ligase
LIIDIAVTGVVFFAVLAWGANEPWAIGIIAICSLVLLPIKIFTDAWRHNGKIRGLSVFLPLLLFLIYAGCQLALGPIPWLGFPGTVERHSTTMYFLLALSCVAITFITANGSGSRSLMKWLVFSIIVLGALEAVLGLVQYLGNYDYIWQFEKTAYRGLAGGTLINRNHYALLMNLCICTGIGYLYQRSMRFMGDEGISFKRLVGAPGAAKLAWLAIWLALMGVALVFSMSRMGIVAMICSIGAILVASKATAKHARRAGAAVALVLLAIMGLAIYIGVDAVLARYEDLSRERESDSGRVALWRDAWKMIEKNPVFGQGLGTFQWTYPAYESVQPDTPARYAHSDYVQALAEVGVVGLALLVWAFGAMWKTAVRNLRSNRDPLIRGVGLAAIGILTAIALQEITDFGLYIPGVLVTAAFLAGLNIRAAALN